MKSLRSQIYFGVAVIVFLLVAIGLVGYSGTTRLDDSSREMRGVFELSSAVLEIDRDVQELQMLAEKFMTSGHDSIRDSGFAVHDKLVRLVAKTVNEQSDVEMLESLEQISSHLMEYRTHLHAVVAERQLRAKLVQSLLPEQSKVITEALASMVLVPSDSADEQTGPRLTTKCQTLFSEAEQLLLRYYASPDSAILNEALDKLSVVVSSLTTFEASAKSQEAVDLLVSHLQEYKRITIRAVQTTRGYLFLVNVVLAGEASEVAYYSGRLRTLAEAKRTSISAAVTATVERVNRMTAYSIPGAMAMALLMAGRLVFLILPPISALTDTFRHLAAGESLVTIPEADRNDEIGEMAKAARVFSDQNQATRNLLLQAEELGGRLKQNAEELAASNKELDSFAYVASHDLKSPLRGIRQLATWIEEDAGELLPEESVQHLQQLSSRVSKMEALLQDLLDYSRVGRFVREPEEVQIGQILHGVMEITDNPANVAVNWPDVLPTFTTVRPPLEQVLLNLVGNAIKHNDKGKEGLINVSVTENEDWYRFRVQDNGPGIDERNHERAFQMYQRVGDNSVDGSGMGLAIVKKQIENVGGSITLTSSRGAGATFEFTWPTRMPEARQEDNND